MFFFFFYEIREQEGRTGLAWGEVSVGTSGKEEDVKKRCGRVNMVQILCKWKNKTC
jgi:hypothetical protein